MATLKAILKSKLNQDGTNTVQLRITHLRKSKFIALFRIKARLFNIEKGEIRKSHPEYKYYSHIIGLEYEKYNDRIKELNKKGLDYVLDDILHDKGDDALLETHINHHMEYLNTVDKFKSVRKYENLLNKVKSYKPETKIIDIDSKWMVGFQHSLRKNEKINSEQTVSRYLKFLKTILNNAEKSGCKVKRESLYFKVTVPKSIQTKLTKDEIRLINGFDDDKLNRTKDTFMLQFLMRGSRVGDILMLRNENIKNGTVRFNEQKTKKLKNVQITSDIAAIINKYQGVSKYGYVLPWMDMSIDLREQQDYQKRLESKTSMINKDLKLIAAKLGIEKRLTSHVARHSFAYIGLKSGADIETIQKLLGHSDIKTTQQYLNTIVSQDELNDSTSSITSFL